MTRLIASRVLAKTVFALCALPMLSLPAVAETDINELITDTLGYTTIQPGVLLLEGETMGTFICKFDISDADFAAFLANGKLEPKSDRVVCIPIEEL